MLWIGITTFDARGAEEDAADVLARQLAAQQPPQPPKQQQQPTTTITTTPVVEPLIDLSTLIDDTPPQSPQNDEDEYRNALTESQRRQSMFLYIFRIYSKTIER
jgi:hypothetical protein